MKREWRKLGAACWADRASGAARAAGQGFAAFARPACDACGGAGDDGVIGDVARDDGSCAHHRAAADAHRGDKCCVGADGGAVLDKSFFPVGGARVGGARVFDVGEGRPWSDEDVFSEDDAAPDARVALDSGSGADDGPCGDEAERADHRVRADLGLGRDHGRGVNNRRGTSTRAAVHGRLIRAFGLRCDACGDGQAIGAGAAGVGCASAGFGRRAARVRGRQVAC